MKIRFQIGTEFVYQGARLKAVKGNRFSCAGCAFENHIFCGMCDNARPEDEPVMYVSIDTHKGIDLRIGTRFFYDDVELEVVGGNMSCEGCYFIEMANCTEEFACHDVSRADCQNVIFKRVEEEEDEN